MHITKKILLLKPDERFISFEFFPPKTDAGFRNLLARLHRMLAMNPLFLTVTWGAGGATSLKSLNLASTCQRDMGITTVLHLTCTNTNKDVIDDALLHAKNAGIRNILALRGDPPRTQEYWTPDCDFTSAAHLVRYIKQQYGDYFCIGVAGYPEGHVEGVCDTQDTAKDLPYLIEKVEAGAEFIVTQLFYDVPKFLEYEQLLHSTPQLKNVVLIPGLMPINTYEVFTRATKLANASLPTLVTGRFKDVINDDEEVKRIGVDLLTGMIDEIDAQTNGRVKGYHFFCLNLEKAVASIMEKSKVLQLVTSNHNEVSRTDEAIASDDDLSDSETPIGRRLKNLALANTNKVAASDASRALVSKAIHDKSGLLEISKGLGALGKDATWDDFPNGRFGDSNSPAYGEIDGYGPTLNINTPQEAVSKWGTPETIEDLSQVFTNYLLGKIDLLPWVSTALSSETAIIQEELLLINSRGWFSLASQPAVNCCPSTDRIFGWGPRNGMVFQKAFVEILIPKTEWEKVLRPKLASLISSGDITYYLGDSASNIESNLPISEAENTKSAITWGVFPQKEVVSPTSIDYQSFKAWNEEVFVLAREWSRCYPKDSNSYKLLDSIHNNYCLVSLVYHKIVDVAGLWRALLD